MESIAVTYQSLLAVRGHFPGSVDFAGGVMLPYSLFAYKAQNPAMRLLISQ